MGGAGGALNKSRTPIIIGADGIEALECETKREWVTRIGNGILVSNVNVLHGDLNIVYYGGYQTSYKRLALLLLLLTHPFRVPLL